MEHDQVGQHLQRPIRCKFGQDGTVKRSVLDLKQQSAVSEHFCVNSFELGYSALKDTENLAQAICMLLLEVLHNVRQVVSRG